jgi:hypothetical protein
MGYHLHITRKKHWDSFAGEPGPDILLEEWLAVVRGDPELRLDGFRELPMADGALLHQADASIAVWTKRRRHRRAGDMARFRRAGGNIVISEPDRDIRRKMWRIAQVLDAKVQGDDGEFYDRFGNPVADAAATQGYWRALGHSLVFRFIWGASASGDSPRETFARFPVVASIYKTSPNGTPQVTGRRVLNIVVPNGRTTPEQRAAIEAARERAKTLGIDFIITEA